MKYLTLFTIIAIVFSCNEKKADQQFSSREPRRELPDTSFWNQPLAVFDTSDYVIQLKHMQEFYDVPGEFGHIAEGKDYFERILKTPSELTTEQTFEPLLNLADDAYIIKTGKPFDYHPTFNYETYSNKTAWQ